MWLLLKDCITFSALECLPKEAYIPAGAYSSTKICMCVGMHTYLYDFFNMLKEKKNTEQYETATFFYFASFSFYLQQNNTDYWL